MFTRRDALITPIIVAAPVVLASCSPASIQTLETELAAVITKVQAAVKAGCAKVPTATSVIEVLLALVGTVNPDVAALAALAQSAIDFINKACAGPAPAPTASVNGKSVPIVFY